MTESQKKIWNVGGTVLAFLAASGIIGILFSTTLQKCESSSNIPKEIVIVLSETFYSTDGINRQRVYIVNNSKVAINNVKMQFNIPDINRVEFGYDVSPQLKFQKKDHSITSNTFIIVFDKIIGNYTAERIYYIDLFWKGNPISIDSIFFESDNCHKEIKMHVSQYLNNNKE